MIVPMTEELFALFWPEFEKIVKAQQSYAYDPNMTAEQASNIWMEQSDEAYGYLIDDKIVGTYYVKANGMGPSGHISNAGFMVDEEARGQGVARKLAEHAMTRARSLGYRAMQFNSVISTNWHAVNLWESMGFEIVGTIPKGYKHSQMGYVDTYIMYRVL